MQLTPLIVSSLAILISSVEAGIHNDAGDIVPEGTSSHDQISGEPNEFKLPNEEQIEEPNILQVLEKRHHHHVHVIQPVEAVDVDAAAIAQEAPTTIFKTITLTTRRRITKTSTLTYRWTTSITVTAPTTESAATASTASTSYTEPSASSSLSPIFDTTTTASSGTFQQTSTTLNQTLKEVTGEPTQSTWVEIQLVGQGLPNVTVTLEDFPTAATILTIPELGTVLTPVTFTKASSTTSLTQSQSVAQVAAPSAPGNMTTPSGFTTLLIKKDVEEQESATA